MNPDNASSGRDHLLIARRTSRTAALTQTDAAARIERKFYLPPGRVDLAYAVLRQVCRKDPDYAEGRVTSLYFDTVELDSYSDSESGDWERHKVRLRWYGEIDDAPLTTGFLERKAKRGLSTTKQRRTFSVAAERLRPRPSARRCNRPAGAC